MGDYTYVAVAHGSAGRASGLSVGPALGQNAFPWQATDSSGHFRSSWHSALLLGACEQAKDIVPGDKEEDKPKAAEAAFQLGEVRAIDPQNRGDSGAKAAVEAAKVTTLMNNFYSAAFLDPAKWQGGQHPDLAPLFTAEAQPGQAANLGNLAMSDLSDKIESVTSSVQNIDRVTFFVDDDGSLPLGLASVSFEAVGKPTGDGEDVVIRHAAQLLAAAGGRGLQDLRLHHRASMPPRGLPSDGLRKPPGAPGGNRSGRGGGDGRCIPLVGAGPDRPDGRSAAESPPPSASTRWPAQRWSPELGQPLFVAVLGTDVRSGPPGGGGGRCDAIHIVAINPQQKAGTILNFPRDSAIAGYTKVNAACTGGVGPMVQALRSATGIPIQYYVTTEFTHFTNLVNDLGGVDVNVPYDMQRLPLRGGLPAGRDPHGRAGGAGVQPEPQGHPEGRLQPHRQPGPLHAGLAGQVPGRGGRPAPHLRLHPGGPACT